MNFPELYLSRPGCALPRQVLTNEQVLARLRENFRGTDEVWRHIETGVKYVFRVCGTKVRYIEEDPGRRVADFAREAVTNCLDLHGVTPGELDLVVYGGIAREYFEPSTAMEVAASIGVERTHAFDVTSACAGAMEAIHVACAHMNLYPEICTALVCSAELTRNFLAYDIQTFVEVKFKAAGLTIGNAAAAWLIRREPSRGGSLRLRGMGNMSVPQHWGLCSAPIDGSFTSFSHELFGLHVLVVPEIRRLLERLGWTAAEVEHYVLHQPGEAIVRKVIEGLEIDPEKAVLSHHLYANTSSTSLALALNRRLETAEVRAGDKIVLATAASGFTMVSAAGEWMGS